MSNYRRVEKPTAFPRFSYEDFGDGRDRTRHWTWNQRIWGEALRTETKWLGSWEPTKIKGVPSGKQA